MCFLWSFVFGDLFLSLSRGGGGGGLRYIGGAAGENGLLGQLLALDGNARVTLGGKSLGGYGLESSWGNCCEEGGPAVMATCFSLLLSIMKFVLPWYGDVVLRRKMLSGVQRGCIVRSSLGLCSLVRLFCTAFLSVACWLVSRCLPLLCLPLVLLLWRLLCSLCSL